MSTTNLFHHAFVLRFDEKYDWPSQLCDLEFSVFLSVSYWTLFLYQSYSTTDSSLSSQIQILQSIFWEWYASFSKVLSVSTDIRESNTLPGDGL